MTADVLRELLDQVRAGRLAVDDALGRLQHLPYESLDCATLDHHRGLRCGFPEVIFCAGKTPEQVATIFDRLAAAGGNVLATRADAAHYAAVRAVRGHAVFESGARCITLRQTPARLSHGIITLVCAGTSDLPVIEESRVTCEMMDQQTRLIRDVGVAGIHRLLARSRELREARVVIVAAGMEGALPSVVGGLVEAPVIAVPTSIGYGASFGGLAALLAMLNSCASGVGVVNIDNGFGAGYLASLINRIGEKEK